MMEDKDVRNPFVARIMLENEKSKAKLYYKENPGSLIPLFEKELKDLGFEFETSSQTMSRITLLVSFVSKDLMKSFPCCSATFIRIKQRI